MEELDGKIEAILFASGDYVPLEKLMQLTGLSSKVIRASLQRIDEKYNQHAVMIQQEGDSWKFAVRNPYMSVVQDLIQNTELTKAVMETLAVIAWKSPILQADLIKIRTNKAYDHIAELVDKGFVIKDKAGRTYALRLTQKFYDYFDVPSQAEIQQVFEGVENKPANQNIISQKKVIDFDGTPRVSMQPAQLEVYDAQEEERQKEKEAARALNIQSMRGEHISYLDKLDDLLHKQSSQNDQIVKDIHQFIPTASQDEDATTQSDEKTDDVHEAKPRDIHIEEKQPTVRGIPEEQSEQHVEKQEQPDTHKVPTEPKTTQPKPIDTSVDPDESIADDQIIEEIDRLGKDKSEDDAKTSGLIDKILEEDKIHDPFVEVEHAKKHLEESEHETDKELSDDEALLHGAEANKRK